MVCRRESLKHLQLIGSRAVWSCLQRSISRYLSAEFRNHMHCILLWDGAMLRRALLWNQRVHTIGLYTGVFVRPTVMLV
jgi:hypothetical protein